MSFNYVFMFTGNRGVKRNKVLEGKKNRGDRKKVRAPDRQLGAKIRHEITGGSHATGTWFLRNR